MADEGMHGAVDRATNSTAFESAARVGYSVSGVLHVLIAYCLVLARFARMLGPELEATAS